MPFTPKQIRRILDPDLIPASRVPQRAMQIAESYLRRRMFVWEDAGVKATFRLYQTAYRDLREVATSYAEQLGITKLANDTKSQQFRRAYGEYVTRRMNALADAVAAEGLRRAVTAWYAGYYGRLWLMDTTTKADVHIPATPPDVSKIQRQTLGQLKERQFQEDVYDDLIRDLLGREWRLQYGDQLDDVVLRIKRAISQGMTDGEGIPDLMRRVRGELGVSTDRRSGYHANFNRVQAITRTVVNTAANSGAADAYQRNADILSGHEWLTARDERVCSRCSALDGTVFPLGSLSRPPAHVNCRCTVIPVIKEEYRVTGDVPPHMTLDEWTAAKADVRALIQDFISVRTLDSERV